MRLALALLLSAAAGGLAAMPLRQSTAVTVQVGPLLDATDKVTPELALTLHYDHIRLSKNGGAFAAKHDANDLAHDENGYYTCVLDAMDTDSPGILVLAWTDANAVPVRQEYAVLATEAYNALYAAGYLTVTVAPASVGAIADEVVAHVDANSVKLAAIVADTNELQVDWTNGGRLDLLLDAIKAMTDLMAVVTTTVATVDANDPNELFTLTAGRDVNDAYTNHAIMVEDATDSHAEVRWIEDYVTSRSVTVDEPFSFTPAPGDRAWIMGTTYGGWMQQIISSLNTSQAPIYYFQAGSSGSGPGGTTYLNESGEDP